MGTASVISMAAHLTQRIIISHGPVQFYGGGVNIRF